MNLNNLFVFPDLYSGNEDKEMRAVQEIKKILSPWIINPPCDIFISANVIPTLIEFANSSKTK